MGATNQNNYNRSLVFVQQLTDNNFGQIQILRNQEGKFVMKNQKSFITGDKRYEDFKKIMQFVRNTENKNILPVMYLQHEHQSHVCIEYERVNVYTEYLNFTLKGLIVNKKSVQQQEIWYCLKSMIQLIVQLENNNLKVIFTLDNIFLTLKGIPCLYLFHMICQDKKNIIKQLNPTDQIVQKADCSYFNLAKSIIQLVNTELIPTQQQHDCIQFLKNQIFKINKRNQTLGNYLRQLLTCTDGVKLLSEIQLLVQNKRIKVSTQIRFNKFRYVMTEQDKPGLALNDLQLKVDNVSDFKQKSLSAVNTPVCRLRENVEGQTERKSEGVKSKFVMIEHSFFKNKRLIGSISKSKRQIYSQNEKQPNGKYQLSRSKLKLQVTKLAHSSLKQNLMQNNKNQQIYTSKINQKLSLISRKLSARNNNKMQKTLNYLNKQEKEQKQSEPTDQQSNRSQHDKDPFKHKQNQHKYYRQDSGNSNQIQGQRNTTTDIGQNKIRDVLNMEIMKNKINSKNQQNILLHNLKIIKPQKAFNYRDDLNSQFGLNLNKTWTKQNIRHNEVLPESQTIENLSQEQETLEEQECKISKKYITQNSRTKQNSLNKKVQKLDINNWTQPSKHSEDNKMSTLRQSLNALDKANFLSTLQMKKYQNNIKSKQISQRKELILYKDGSKMNLVSNKQNQNSVKQFFTHQETKKSFGLQTHLSNNFELQGQNTKNHRNSSLQLRSKQPNFREIDNNSRLNSTTTNQRHENKQNTQTYNYQKNKNNFESNNNKYRTMSESEKRSINLKRNNEQYGYE